MTRLIGILLSTILLLGGCRATPGGGGLISLRPSHTPLQDEYNQDAHQWRLLLFLSPT